MTNRITILLFLIFAGSASAGEVQIQSKSEVKGPFVTLGDIARFAGFPAKERNELKRIKLGRSPSIGQRRIIPQAYLRTRVKRALPAGSTLKMSKQTEVRRRHTTIFGGDLKAQITAKVEARIGDRMVDVAQLKVPEQSRLRIPDGAHVEIRFDNRQHSEDAVRVLIVIVDGEQERLARKSVVSIDVFTDVITLNRDRKRGEMVRSGDVITNRIASSQVPRDALTTADQAIGAVLKRSVRRGDTLRSNWVDIPPVVLRGQRIRIIARRGSIRLSTMGEALSKGRSQEFIRVRNLSSKKIVSGRVTPDGNVEMEF